MKKFSCGDVVPGCSATFEGASDEEIFAAVGPHAAEAHGMDDVPDEVIEAVRRSITSV